MRIRIITFGLTVPAEAYTKHAEKVAAAFTEWPGLVAKWWLADPASGVFGGVYLFANEQDADRSRETELFQGMFVNPAMRDVVVREFDVLDDLTAITAPAALAG